ncbi:hypothetical protein [Silvibacterium dinghuense]|uniref:DUF4386 domain-containing protein n=1 Tax=Silvibacterium dinghuense TaxID=1560006 RepID=A0A4Q1SBI7_9BACT|nr:hypothetical protein [Silvibacterium dinghuense]RXS94498.1 hypothetical protein ESZ00_15640 [Silvibacterium dinghuense]GGH15723.1 hypothetical protein GCM10011586_37020 [Silvibacterium dinghuense]
MSELSRALGDIERIRQQVAESAVFRGYGPATVAGTGLLAVLASLVQSAWLPEPGARHAAYLLLWIGTAVASILLIAFEMFARTRRMHTCMASAMVRMAVEQLLPAVAVGVLLTVAVARYVAADFWMLPALWQVIFSLGIFASCRFLPRYAVLAGGWYLVSGLVLISFAGARALSPWAMGLPFGAGQILAAMALLWGAKEEEDAE